MSHEPDLILQGVQRRRPPWVGFIRLCCQKFLGAHATSAFSNLVPDTIRLHDFCSTLHWIAILTDLKPLGFILQLIYVLPKSWKILYTTAIDILLRMKPGQRDDLMQTRLIDQAQQNRRVGMRGVCACHGSWYPILLGIIRSNLLYVSWTWIRRSQNHA